MNIKEFANAVVGIPSNLEVVDAKGNSVEITVESGKAVVKAVVIKKEGNEN